MKKERNSKILLAALLAAGLAGACRDDEEGAKKPVEYRLGAGMFILNEGAWNANNASLDFWHEETNDYTAGIFAGANPGAVLGLGELGNDIGLYGAKLYLVINGSDKVEVVSAATGKRLKTIPFQQPRHVTFSNGRAYVSAYGGGSDARGTVAEVDTSTLAVTRALEVGRQPEDLVVAGGKLHVALSGGLAGTSDPAGYERVIAVIRLDDFTCSDSIDVAINLHRLEPDGRGNLYVNSRGNYGDVPPRLFVVDVAAGQVVDTIDVPASNFTIAGDAAYVIGMQYSSETNQTVHGYYKIDTRTRQLLPGGFITDGSEREIASPYGIAVHPVTGDILVTDAKTYDIAGKIYRFSPAGRLLDERAAGVIPAHVAFK